MEHWCDVPNDRADFRTDLLNAAGDFAAVAPAIEDIAEMLVEKQSRAGCKKVVRQSGGADACRHAGSEIGRVRRYGPQLSGRAGLDKYVEAISHPRAGGIGVSIRQSQTPNQLVRDGVKQFDTDGWTVHQPCDPAAIGRWKHPAAGAAFDSLLRFERRRIEDPRAVPFFVYAISVGRKARARAWGEALHFTRYEIERVQIAAAV